MRRSPVISREYKAMLRPSRFGGDERALLKAALAFQADLSRAVADIIVRAKGAFAKPSARRRVVFFDTATHSLHAASYLCRERRDVATGARELTLKFRHPDRHIAADRSMDAARGRRPRTKFEEDVKGPFVSFYSFSTTLEIGEHRTIARMRDLARLFPDLEDRLQGFDSREPLDVVNGFVARELVLGGPILRLMDKPRTDAECALIVWYADDRRPPTPRAVEFSYRYGNKSEAYDGATARAAFDVFGVLTTRLSAWVDPNPRTKTGLVYGQQA